MPRIRGLLGVRPHETGASLVVSSAGDRDERGCVAPGVSRWSPRRVGTLPKFSAGPRANRTWRNRTTPHPQKCAPLLSPDAPGRKGISKEIGVRPKLIVHLGSATVIGLLSIFAFDFAYSSRIGVGLDTLPARIPADTRIALVLGYSIHFAKSAILGWLLCSALCFLASLRPVVAAALLSVGVLFFAQFTELVFAIKDHKWDVLSLHFARVGIFFVA